MLPKATKFRYATWFIRTQDSRAGMRVYVFPKSQIHFHHNLKEPYKAKIKHQIHENNDFYHVLQFRRVLNKRGLIAQPPKRKPKN